MGEPDWPSPSALDIRGVGDNMARYPLISPCTTYKYKQVYAWLPVLQTTGSVPAYAARGAIL